VSGPSGVSTVFEVPSEEAPPFEQMARAIRWLVARRDAQPRLADLADVLGRSPWHAQRVFTRWAGLSPKQFLAQLTLEAAKARLRAGASVLDAALEVGLSGPSRLHDLFVRLEAMTPGEYRALGAGLELRFGVHPTPFGPALFVTSPRGLARLAFLGEGGLEATLAEARADWPRSRFVEDPSATAELPAAVFARAEDAAPLRVLVKGTAFQVRVWRALLRIPEGAVATYGGLAAALGAPGASRAVGAACGRNRIGWLIPCHRVIRESGALGGYHWGLDRKRAMLALEAARSGTIADA
jgi:AraC family transcriptional regulator of adaptative response/methylated-DNA-[protein]-cysteine methyltransferase